MPVPHELFRIRKNAKIKITKINCGVLQADRLVPVIFRNCKKRTEIADSRI